MYIFMCNNLLDGKRISQIGVFVLQTWYYVYEIFLVHAHDVWYFCVDESFHINYLWRLYYVYNLFAHKSSTPSRGFSKQTNKYVFTFLALDTTLQYWITRLSCWTTRVRVGFDMFSGWKTRLSHCSHFLCWIPRFRVRYHVFTLDNTFSCWMNCFSFGCMFLAMYVLHWIPLFCID